MNLNYRKMASSLVLGLLMSIPSFSAQTAKEIYQNHCTICHASGLAGAPKFQSKTDWLPRCETKHLSGLVKSAMQGINAMPAKGTCASCEVEDIRQAIEYMVPKNEKKCHEK